jgi:hypothetical protein
LYVLLGTDYFDHIYGEWETRKFNALDIIERIHPLFVFAISPKAISRPSLPSEHSPLASVETSNGLKILNTLCQHRDTNKEVLVTSCSNNRNYMEYYVFQRLSMLENYKMLTIIPEPDTHCHTMFMDATHVYIIGGRVLAGWTTSSCYSIPWNMEDNKKKKKYVEIPRMSVPRHNHVGVLLNNRYYVFGGMLENGFNTIESCEHFDITSQTWHTISSLPKPLPTRLECAVVLSDRIIAVVGRMVDSVNCKVQLYDTIANTWSTADWSLPFYSIDSGFVADCTLINGKKYLFAMLTSIDISMIIAELYSPFAIGQWTEFCIR